MFQSPTLPSRDADGTEKIVNGLLVVSRWMVRKLNMLRRKMGINWDAPV
jgi:hypothetical protein